MTLMVLSAFCLAHLLSGCATKMPSERSAFPASDYAGTVPGSVRTKQSTGVTLSNSGRADELWIIARADPSPAEQPSELPGSGELLAKFNQQEISIAPKHTDVQASVSGYIAAVRVTQQFQNPYSNTIEAVYLFPLPHNAAINEFIMTIGEHRIGGIIRDRTEAQQIYQEAKRQGYLVSLMTEEQPGTFRQAIANIEPAKEIAVKINYFHTLEFVNGWYQFVFPMARAPRPVPSNEPVNDVSLKLEVNAGVPIEESQCETHKVTLQSPSPERLLVSLEPEDKLPNRDFILRFRVADVASPISSDSFSDAAFPGIWARARIAALARQSTHSNEKDWAVQLRQEALDYGLLSNLTAFVAVDSSRPTAGAQGNNESFTKENKAD
jgi:hypothetical protein